MLQIRKKKKMKEKGIALCHKAQGYSANQRPVSLLMKSEIDPENLTDDVIKSLQQVTVTMSMEEFLQKFFGLWQTDAEILTKLLGLTTEIEDKLQKGELDNDVWEKQWAESHQNYIEERLSQFSIMKSAVLGDKMSNVDIYNILQVQQLFEKSLSDNGIVIELTGDEERAENNKPAEEVIPEPQVLTVDKISPEALDKANEAPENQETTKSQQESNVTDVVDVTKSAEYIDLQKKLEEFEKANAAQQEMLKAAEEVLKAKQKEEMLQKASEMTFVSEDEKESVAEILKSFKDTNSLDAVLKLVEKANTKIEELNKAVADKEAELVEVKKQFGETEHGTESKPAVVSDRQDFINQQAALLKAAKETK